jgi:hypothetical protein
MARGIARRVAGGNGVMWRHVAAINGTAIGMKAERNAKIENQQAKIEISSIENINNQ